MDTNAGKVESNVIGVRFVKFEYVAVDSGLFNGTNKVFGTLAFVKLSKVNIPISSSAFVFGTEAQYCPTPPLTKIV
jgi:hypothetical protein